MKRNSLPPDFFLPPWRSNREFQFLSEDELRIGDCVEYINERTGEFGVRIKIRGKKNYFPGGRKIFEVHGLSEK